MTSAKTNEALKLINTQKFIMQNNFIPVPSMMMSTVTSPKGMSIQEEWCRGINKMDMTQPNGFNFYSSGENLT
jgi:hypothetical protein